MNENSPHVVGYRVAIVRLTDESLLEARLFVASELELALRYYRLLQSSADAEGCDVQVERAYVRMHRTIFGIAYCTLERTKGPDSGVKDD